MKFLIVYSSRTGNTKKVAEALFRAAPEGSTLRSVDETFETEGYDVIFAGYWLDRGGADERSKQFLRTLTGKRIVLFETMGADPASEHAAAGFANAATALSEGNTVLGAFAVRGEVDPALVLAMKKRGADNPHGSPEAMSRIAQAKGHPDETDLSRAEGYMKAFTEKYRRYYLRG